MRTVGAVVSAEAVRHRCCGATERYVRFKFSVGRWEPKGIMCMVRTEVLAQTALHRCAVSKGYHAFQIQRGVLCSGGQGKVGRHLWFWCHHSQLASSSQP
jgi:hypothetical protein